MLIIGFSKKCVIISIIALYYAWTAAIKVFDFIKNRMLLFIEGEAYLSFEVRVVQSHKYIQSAVGLCTIHESWTFFKFTNLKTKSIRFLVKLVELTYVIHT